MALAAKVRPAACAYPADIDAEPASDPLQQPSDITIAKQIAVPHGNSILALGAFETVSAPDGTGVCQKSPIINGRPVIPDAPFPYPMPATPISNAAPPPSLKSILNVDERYSTQLDAMTDYQNPHPDLT